MLFFDCFPDFCPRFHSPQGEDRQKVWRTIKNLEKNKTIWGYTAVVDEQKLGKKSFALLIKRSNKPITKKILDMMCDRKFMKRIEELEGESVSHLFMHGKYDWLIIFNALDIRVAKNYVEELIRTYGEYISEIDLQEILFPVQIFEKVNPNIEILKDFFKT